MVPGEIGKWEEGEGVQGGGRLGEAQNILAQKCLIQ